MLTMPETLRLRLDHRVAMEIAATEYQRVISTLERLSPADWGRPTDCPGWDVRAMAGHMLGMAEYPASLVQLLRQTVISSRRAGRDHIEEIDALAALQVQDHARLGTAELIERFRTVAPRAVRGRSRIPQFLQSRAILTQADWAARHGQPYELELTGEAGGHWAQGQGGERLQMEAIEFCRILSGRDEGTGLMASHVPF
jgi:hypothetical protein